MEDTPHFDALRRQAARRARADVVAAGDRSRATVILQRALDEAHDAGYRLALAELEREIYSCESIEEVFDWIVRSLNSPSRDSAPDGG